MIVKYIWEHNGNDSLIYADSFPGAFVRGQSKEEALPKFDSEIRSYILWRDQCAASERFTYEMAGEHATGLAVCDADTEVIFESEKLPLTAKEYQKLKALALRSAQCFQALYDSVPDKNATCLEKRKTFYGEIPTTAMEMYEHTKCVNEYYFGEIGIKAGNDPDIAACRLKAFEVLEKQPDYLNNTVFDGSYGEQWSLCKVCRRFVWHDRIHAKAMWRMAIKLFGVEKIENPFFFAN